MKTVTFEVDGMHCDSCAARIKTVLEMEPGVRQAAVSYAASEARIAYNPHATSEGRLVEIIEGASFRVGARCRTRGAPSAEVRGRPMFEESSP